MSPRRTTLLALALAVAAPLGAQSPALAAEAEVPAAAAPLVAAPAATPATPAADAADARTAAGPSAELAPAALRLAPRAAVSAEQEEAALQARARNGFSQSQVLMIVGGAALLTGLIIGDDVGDILAIGGAGVGLYGLYRYLQGR